MLGQPVVIENRGGTGGVGEASRAEPDGHTLVVGDIASMGINLHVYDNLVYDPLEDFDPVFQITSIPLVMAVGPRLEEVAELPDLIARAKENPEHIDYASAAVGPAQDLAFELFRSLAGIEALHIPYQGSAPARTALMSGEVRVMIDGTVMPMIKDGTLRAPAVTSEERVAALPDVPTVKEQGVDMVYTSWHGIMAPKGTDPEIVAAVNRALDEILTRPDIRERFGALNAGLVDSCPVAVTAFVTEQAGALSELIEMSGDSRNRARTGAPDDPAPAFHERTDDPRWMMSDQPHVLFVTVDQWPAHLLGCMGHPDIETPTLDMLARSGTLYRNCYAETPICIPSRRSMMTGLTARGHGDRNLQPTLRMPAKARTLAGAFSAAGDQTGAIGKLHAYPHARPRRAQRHQRPARGAA
ncbi:tripartite tricarboxylate transporter substrate-binding protein [Salipiger thiooxidans]